MIDWEAIIDWKAVDELSPEATKQLLKMLEEAGY